MAINFKGSHYPKDMILYAVFRGGPTISTS
jgi:hypothetical protein